jgi:DNA modification methylase
MAELGDGSVDLIVTSPPYWQIKDYGAPGQLGFCQSLHEYLFDLSRVWRECARVLAPGRRLCVNIGDQFARALIYGRYKIIPLHAEVIAQCESLGLDYLGAIIWQKKTTMNTSGGATVMGSFPHPPNGIVELDYEYILLFKKPGPTPKVSPACKEASKLTTDEWKQFFAGHWTFGGARQTLAHEAMFPDELPRRLIRMFSFVGDTVLDPFLGSGTTARVAMDLGRSAVGYEINPDFLPVIRSKLCTGESGSPRLLAPDVSFVERRENAPLVVPPDDYRLMTPEALPLRDPKQFRFGQDQQYKVVEIVDERTLRLDTGLVVTLLGVAVPPAGAERARTYLRTYLLNKPVHIKFDEGAPADDPDAPLPAYLQLTNKLFINRKMIEMGLALADRSRRHRLRDKFLAAEETARGAA